MTRVILITFGFMGWAWFEMSGGSEFEPGENGISVLADFKTPVEEQVLPPVETAEAPSVARNATTTPEQLTRVTQPRIIVKAAPTFAEETAEEAKLATLLASPDNGTRIDASQDESLPSSIVIGGLSGDLNSLGRPIGLRSDDPIAGAIVAAVDYRVVSGSRVNLRSGPSTDFAVVTRLLRGNEVEILQDNDDGWVKLRALDGNHIGWMSDSFLVAAD